MVVLKVIIIDLSQFSAVVLDQLLVQLVRRLRCLHQYALGFLVLVVKVDEQNGTYRHQSDCCDGTHPEVPSFTFFFVNDIHDIVCQMFKISFRDIVPLFFAKLI